MYIHALLLTALRPVQCHTSYQKKDTVVHTHKYSHASYTVTCTHTHTTFSVCAPNYVSLFVYDTQTHTQFPVRTPWVQLFDFFYSSWER